MKNLANEIIGSTLLILSVFTFCLILSSSCKAATGSSLEQMNADYAICLDELDAQYKDDNGKLEDASVQELIEMQIECEEENLR